VRGPHLCFEQSLGLRRNTVYVPSEKASKTESDVPTDTKQCAALIVISVYNGGLQREGRIDATWVERTILWDVSRRT
jgi:hypothetical protein